MAAANALTDHAADGVLTEAAMYDSHAANFMNSWTVFYWVRPTRFNLEIRSTRPFGRFRTSRIGFGHFAHTT
jgi:hypothetical protein